jgi:HEAT repeat protein
VQETTHIREAFQSTDSEAVNHALDPATPDQRPPLLDAESAQLTEFARACRTAVHDVMWYPDGHPAIAATLGRLVDLTSPTRLVAPLYVGVRCDRLLLHGQRPVRSDPALGELAALLHAHRVGELAVYAGADADTWRGLLQLLARTPERLRTEGGIARCWAATGHRLIEVFEIDYRELLRERPDGSPVARDDVIASCLLGGELTWSDEAIRYLLQVAGDVATLSDLVRALETRGAGERRGSAVTAAALVRVLQAMVSLIAERVPDRLDATLSHVATAIGQLSADTMVALVSTGVRSTPDGQAVRALLDTVLGRMSETTIAQFVARNTLAEGAPIERIAQAFQALVRGPERQDGVLALARDCALSASDGLSDRFEHRWAQLVEQMLTSYSDEPFVTDAYARELSTARARAVEVEQVRDDPPERLMAWLATVATSELRQLELALALALLNIEEECDRWATLMPPVVVLLDDLFLVGDVAAAEPLLEAIVRQTRPHAPARKRDAAVSALSALVAGPAIRSMATHLATIDDREFARVEGMCLSLGERLIQPLAEVLAGETRTRARERLTQVLLAFGAIGRSEIERLKASPHATVRRTAIHLLRELRGSDVLPDLTELLDDAAPQVQRDAVRAILNIGTDRSFEVIERALASGTPRSRRAILQVLIRTRDARITPLFSYLVRHLDHRGPLLSVYVGAIRALGELQDPAGIWALQEALYRGEWWAPRRSARLRAAVAGALGRIGTPDAVAVLEAATEGGPRGVRSAARAALDRMRAVTEGDQAWEG